MKVPEHYRLKTGSMASDSSYGNNGVFIIPESHRVINCIVSDGGGWDHVSVTVAEMKRGKLRTVMPTWDIMCRVKDRFWDEDECVVQFHPPKSQYVNCHPMCLHLWKKQDQEYEVPDPMLVGIK